MTSVAQLWLCYLQLQGLLCLDRATENKSPSERLPPQHHRRPQRDAHPPVDEQLKLPISLPIGCSGFDWFVINSSYWPVEQDGWRHAFVPLTHYPTELGLQGGGSGHQYRVSQLLSLPSSQHTHSHTTCSASHTLRHTISHTHTQTLSQCSADSREGETSTA